MYPQINYCNIIKQFGISEIKKKYFKKISIFVLQVQTELIQSDSKDISSVSILNKCYGFH